MHTDTLDNRQFVRMFVRLWRHADGDIERAVELLCRRNRQEARFLVAVVIGIMVSDPIVYLQSRHTAEDVVSTRDLFLFLYALYERIQHAPPPRFRDLVLSGELSVGFAEGYLPREKRNAAA